MASTLLTFGNVDYEREIYNFSECIQDFFGRIIDEEHWGVHTQNRFGPIVYVGVLRDLRDDSHSIFMQVWGEHADTLFLAMDEFLSECDSSLEYERSDRV